MNRITERLLNSGAPGGNRGHTGAPDKNRGHAGALLPYLTAGFPNLAATAGLIRRATDAGAAVIELGFPFSDSIADGPVIQDSFHVALENGLVVEDIFRCVADVRDSVDCGLIAMVSYSIVHRLGVSAFMNRAVEAGFDGVIVPDVPVEESSGPLDAAKKAGLCYIGLVAPTTSPARREAIARSSTGFVYQVAVAGTTGERSTLSSELAGEVKALQAVSGLPVCVGFGISTPDHVRTVCAFADGAIVGSAVVRRIADAIKVGLSSDALVDSVGQFFDELMAGTTRT